MEIGNKLQDYWQIIISVIIAVNLFSIYIESLKQLNITYFQRIHRVAEIITFEFNYPISIFLTITTFILLSYMLKKDRKKAIIIGILPIFSFLFQSIETGIILTSTIVTFYVAYHEKKYTSYFENLLKILLVIESTTIIHYILLTLGMTSPLQQIALFEYDLFCISRFAAPILVFMFIFAFHSDSIKKQLQRFYNIIDNQNESKKRTITEYRIPPNLVLVLAIIFAVFWAIFPWIPTINPIQIGFGKDAGKFYWTMMKMDEGQYFSIGPRSLFINLLYYCYKIFNLDSFYFVNLLPVILNPLLVFSVYHFVCKSSEDEELAALSALMTSVGFNITVGMHSYFLPNMLGLSLVFFSFGYLLMNLRKKKKSLNLISIILMVPIFYIHPWTFFQYFGVLCLFAVYLIIKRENVTRTRRYKKENVNSLSPLLIYIVSVGLLYILSNIVIPIDDSMNRQQVFVGFKFVVDQFVYSNVFTFNTLYMGIMGNSVYLLICLVGSFLLKKDTYFNRYLSVFILISTIVYIFSHAVFPNGALGNYFPSRLLLNYPLGIFSAIALQKLIHSTYISDKSKLYFMLFFITYMTVYMFRSIYHLIPLQ